MKMISMYSFVFVFFLLLGAVVELKSAEGSFDVFSAETISRGGEQYYVNQKWASATTFADDNNRVPENNQQKRIDWRITFGANYAFDKHWQVGVFVPIVNRRYRINKNANMITGLGDTTTYVKNMFYKTTWKRGSLKSSWIFGLDLPTGSINNSERGARLPHSYQLGDGHVNSILGLSTGAEFDKFGVSLLGLYTAKLTGPHHFNPGNVTEIGLTMKYRFLQEPYPGSSGNLRWGVVYVHKDKNRRFNSKTMNSGGHRFDGKVGWVHHKTPDKDLTLFYRFPLSNKLHGQQLVTEHSAELVLGWRY